LLVAFIYHLYAGLLSGGQVLIGKRKLARKVFGGQVKEESSVAAPGEAVVHFGGRLISAVKRELRQTTDGIGEALDEPLRARVLTEGVKVFELNNSIIKTVTGVEEIFCRRLMIALVLLAGVAAIVAYVFFT